MPGSRSSAIPRSSRAKRRPRAPASSAITGTNGKSTTTALIGHVLAAGGLDVDVGGNIGKAVFLLRQPVKDRVYVLELSSFQIDLMPGLRPDVGILTNLTPDHLDRHGTMENYAAVKARMFARQGAGDTALCGVDDAWCATIADSIARWCRPPPRVGDAAAR